MDSLQRKFNSNKWKGQFFHHDSTVFHNEATANLKQSFKFKIESPKSENTLDLGLGTSGLETL